MSQLRLNPLTGRWVTLAADRATRPGDLTARRSGNEFDDGRPCPFCPGNEEATPPALETYGPGGSWLVRVVPNLYPALGDPDAVSVGDYHLPGQVGWALAGEKVDDDGMLALLEPYRGHRYRVIRYLLLSGLARVPRRGPRLAVEDHRSR